MRYLSRENYILPIFLLVRFLMVDIPVWPLFQLVGSGFPFMEMSKREISYLTDVIFFYNGLYWKDKFNKNIL